jgi:hypothetical protein
MDWIQQAKQLFNVPKPVHFTNYRHCLPALIRITLATMDKPQERYLDQFLFHLMRDGKDHDLVRACSPEQCAFIAGFLEYLIDQYAAAIDESTYADDVLKACEIWSVG